MCMRSHNNALTASKFHFINKNLWFILLVNSINSKCRFSAISRNFGGSPNHISLYQPKRISFNYKVFLTWCLIKICQLFVANLRFLRGNGAQLFRSKTIADSFTHLTMEQGERMQWWAKIEPICNQLEWPNWYSPIHDSHLWRQYAHTIFINFNRVRAEQTQTQCVNGNNRLSLQIRTPLSQASTSLAKTRFHRISNIM